MSTAKGKNKRVRQEQSHSAPIPAIKLGFTGYIECVPNESHGPINKKIKLGGGFKSQTKNNKVNFEVKKQKVKCVQPRSREKTMTVRNQGPTNKKIKQGGGFKSQTKNNKVNSNIKKRKEKCLQPRSCEKTSMVRYEDKKSGNYERHSMKKKVSSGEKHVEKGSGRVGVKDESSRTSRVKIGNKSGYTEYYTEERVRKVNFGKKKSSGHNNFVLTGECYVLSSDESSDESFDDSDKSSDDSDDSDESSDDSSDDCCSDDSDNYYSYDSYDY